MYRDPMMDIDLGCLSMSEAEVADNRPGYFIHTSAFISLIILMNIKEIRLSKIIEHSFYIRPYIFKQILPNFILLNIQPTT